MYRSFDADVEAYAKRWHDRPIEQLHMVQQGDFTPSADGACLVQFDGDRLAFTKPRPGNPANLVVAREKIAADIAYLVELPVAPLLVKPPCGTWPQYRAVSLVSLPSTRGWGDGGEVHKAAASPTLEALRVFWTFIADTDHDGHPQNLLYQLDGAAVKLVAIDHSYSLGHGALGNPLAMGAVIGYGTAHDHASQAVRLDVIGRIQALEREAIVSIVRRLRDILTGDEQDFILRLLFARQDALPALLAN